MNYGQPNNLFNDNLFYQDNQGSMVMNETSISNTFQGIFIEGEENEQNNIQNIQQTNQQQNQQNYVNINELFDFYLTEEQNKFIETNVLQINTQNILQILEQNYKQLMNNENFMRTIDQIYNLSKVNCMKSHQYIINVLSKCKNNEQIMMINYIFNKKYNIFIQQNIDSSQTGILIQFMLQPLQKPILLIQYLLYFIKEDPLMATNLILSCDTQVLRQGMAIYYAIKGLQLPYTLVKMANTKNAACYMTLYIYLNGLIDQKNLIVINNIDDYAKQLGISLRKHSYRQFITQFTQIPQSIMQQIIYKLENEYKHTLMNMHKQLYGYIIVDKQTQNIHLIQLYCQL